MNITRRSFIGFTLSSLFGSKGLPLLAQGIASRGVKAQARPAGSGRPFNARFVDVGLRIHRLRQ
jgi:hypothetical protein